MRTNAARTEVLGNFGDDKAAAWDEAIRLAELLCENGAQRTLKVRAERRCGDWAVVLYRYQPAQRAEEAGEQPPHPHR